MSWKINNEGSSAPCRLRETQPSICPSSARLDRLARWVLRDATVADVGCDHGELAVGLLRARRVSRAIASDIGDVPLRGAAARAREHGVEGRLSLRHAPGLRDIGPGEAQTVVIAGMGGRTIARIIDAADLRALGTQRVVLQPERDEADVRDALARQGYRIRHEEFLREGDRIFLLMWAEPSVEQVRLSAQDRLLGPVLRHSRDPWFLAWLEIQRRWMRDRVRGLSQSGSPEAERAAAELRIVEDQIKETSALTSTSAGPS